MAIVGSNHGPFGVGDIFTVRVSHATPGRVLNQARLSIAFDAASVMPMSVSTVAGSPFANEISETIDLQAGTIRYIVGSTYGSGSAAADADIEFIVLPNAANCGTAAAPTRSAAQSVAAATKEAKEQVEEGAHFFFVLFFF